MRSVARLDARVKGVNRKQDEKNHLAKIFPIILVVIAVGGPYFVFKMLVPLLQARSNLKDDEAFGEDSLDMAPLKQSS